jgi:hypothetical protein
MKLMQILFLICKSPEDKYVAVYPWISSLKLKFEVNK